MKHPFIKYQSKKENQQPIVVTPNDIDDDYRNTRIEMVQTTVPTDPSEIQLWRELNRVIQQH